MKGNGAWGLNVCVDIFNSYNDTASVRSVLFLITLWGLTFHINIKTGCCKVKFVYLWTADVYCSMIIHGCLILMSHGSTETF